MFVRCKPNKSGSTSVQIVDKSSGKYVVHKTLGSSSGPRGIDFLVGKAKQQLLTLGGQGLLLKSRGYQYILGARIRNMGTGISGQILALQP